MLFLPKGKLASPENVNDSVSDGYYLNSIGLDCFDRYTNAAIPGDRKRVLCWIDDVSVRVSRSVGFFPINHFVTEKLTLVKPLLPSVQLF